MTQVAERVNFAFFKQVASGTAVRIGGRISDGQLTTTDGGVLSISGLDTSVSEFVELVGTKTSDSAVKACGASPLGENIDVELWEEALKMTRLPQLRSLFEPTAIAA